MYNHPSQMTPLFPTGTSRLTDLAIRVIRESAALGGQLHPISRREITRLVKIINSYYSNLIEGRHTHPVDIERAMNNDYSHDPAKKTLQIESKVHIEVQNAIELELADENLHVGSSEFIQSIHHRFYERLPAELKIIRNERTGEEFEVIPGVLRQHEVKVGRHVAPAYTSLPAFLQQFESSYDLKRLHGELQVVAAAASHHRLLWIHPFSDGNGRVVRLFTDAFMHKTTLIGYGLWTVSRGLARHREDYLAALTWGDSPRQGDLDGRGNLSSKGLKKFCIFFLETCLDQMNFMGKLLQLDGLLDRIKGYVQLRHQKMLPDAKPLKPEATHMLQEALLRGKFARGEAMRITGLSERTARAMLSELVKEGLLVSESPKGPVSLRIPTHVASYWFPNLFPEKFS